MTTLTEELAAFLAAAPEVDELAGFHFSERGRRRVADLIRREKAEGATPDECEEIDAALALEHLVRMTKLRIAGASAAPAVEVPDRSGARPGTVAV